MNYRRKRRRTWSAAAGIALGVLLGLPGGASASCDPPTPPADADVGMQPPGLFDVAKTCSGSPFEIAAIGRRHR